jgi:hypothetical protein
MRIMAIALGTVLTLATLPAVARPGAPTPAEAQGKKDALPYAEQGLQRFDEGKYAEAIEQFERAERFFHAPTHVSYLARSHEKLGQLLDARRLYQQLADETLAADAPARFVEAQQQARAALTRLAQAIPSVTLELVGPARERASVSLDGKAWSTWREQPAQLDPGEHRIEVGVEGGAPAERTIRLAESQHERVTIELGATAAAGAPGEPPRGSMVPGAVVLSIGAAGLLVGAITGGVSMSKVSELADRCPTKHCAAEDEPLGTEAKTLGNVSTAALVIGGVGAAVGAVLLIWPPGSGEQPTEDAVQVGGRLCPGAGLLYLKGRF